MSTGGGGASKAVLWTILAIGGGLLLLCGCCGGAFFLFWSKYGTQTMAAAQAQPVAQNFFSSLSAGNIDGAYEMTSKAYQKRQSKSAFKSLVEKNPALKSGGAPQLTPDVEQSTAETVLFKVTSPTNCTVKMAKEDGQWKVEDFTVP